MSKIKLLTISVIGLLIVNIFMLTFIIINKPGKGPDGRPPMTQLGPKKIIIDKLHFDKSQVAEFENLIEQHQIKIELLNDSINVAKNVLYSTLAINFKGKDSLINELGSLQKKVELTHYDHFASIRKLCKPDQVEFFNQLTKELAMFFTMDKNDGPPPSN